MTTITPSNKTPRPRLSILKKTEKAVVSFRLASRDSIVSNSMSKS
jgi:hypothetical protein